MPEAHIHADHDMTDPARPPSVELELLLRYLDGDLAPDEQRAVDERLATDREHRVALDALAHAFPHAASRSGPWSSDALLRRVEAQLVEHPRLASRPRPVTRLHVVRAHREPPRWWLRAAAVAPRYNRLSKTLSVIGDIFGFARHAFGIVTIARRRPSCVTWPAGPAAVAHEARHDAARS